MININDEMTLRRILMNHFTKPENKGLDNNPNAITQQLKSKTCADEIFVELVLKDNKIKELKFDGTACVVATSSTDILINEIKGKTIQQAIEIINKYNDLLDTGNLENVEELNELAAFKNIYKQRNRVLCATLPTNGLLKILNNNVK